MSNTFHNSDSTIFRSKIESYFITLVGCDKIGKNIEKGIYNYTIQESTFRQIIKKWTNPLFCDIYSSRLKTIIHNLTKNPDLLEQVKSHQITPEALSSMTHQEMMPSHWKDKIELKTKRDRSKFSTNLEVSSILFSCKKCKSKRCTYYELQTRSADEPATIFITCLDCGKNWKN